MYSSTYDSSSNTPNMIDILKKRRKFKYRDIIVMTDIICEYFAMMLHFFLLNMFFVGLTLVNCVDIFRNISIIIKRTFCRSYALVNCVDIFRNISIIIKRTFCRSYDTPDDVPSHVKRRKYNENNLLKNIICEYFAIIVHFFLLTAFFVGLIIVCCIDASQYIYKPFKHRLNK